MEVLQIKGVCKNFGGLQILTDLALNVGAGERVAVIGPNGAGKTTLLNIITGELSCSAGQLYLLGQEITRMPTHRRIQLGMGRSFQITRLLSELTVVENILLALYGIRSSRYHPFRRYYADSELMTKAQKLLETTDLWGAKDKPVKDISYGEQRKLEIVLSLASESKLLLLDEPTAGLSIAEVPIFVNTIKALARDTTVLFTSHDMDVVFALASRVIVLYFGQMIAEGTPEQIRCDPKVSEIYLGTATRKESA